MIDSIRNFTIDRWYKLLALVSAGLLVVSLTVPLQVPNKPVVLIALGGFLFGLGQWINHPLQEQIGGGFKISGYPRRSHPGGVITEIVGTVLAACGIWLLAG